MLALTDPAALAAGCAPVESDINLPQVEVKSTSTSSRPPSATLATDSSSPTCRVVEAFPVGDPVAVT